MQNTDENEAVIPGPPATQEDLTQELLHDSLQTGSRMRKALLISGMLSILGFVGLFMHFASGTNDHTTWNFYAVVYFYDPNLVRPCGLTPYVSHRGLLNPGIWPWRPMARKSSICIKSW